MWRHYRSLLKPGLLLGSIDKVESTLGLLGFVVLLLNRPLGRRLLNLEGVSSWWAAAPIAILFTHAFLKAEYNKVCETRAILAATQKQLVALQPNPSDSVVLMVRHELLRMAKDAREYAKLMETLDNPNGLQEYNEVADQVLDWSSRVREMLGAERSQHFDETWRISRNSDLPLGDTLRLLTARMSEFCDAIQRPADIEQEFYRRCVKQSPGDGST